MNRYLPVFLSLLLTSSVAAFAQSGPPFVGIGDSLGEGDQSANAFSSSQESGYLPLVAAQIGVPFQLPLIQSSDIGFVGLTIGRSRIDTSLVPADLAVSGANTQEVLTATASHRANSEAGLVLPPYYGQSQAAIVGSIHPTLVYSWVGNDDLTPLILDFMHLNAPSGVTSLADFTTEYQQLIAELQASGAKVVVANIPDLTQVGFLFDNRYLTKYTGTNYKLPKGSLTTLGAVILLDLGVLTASDLSNPAYVLDAAAVSSIQSQVTAFNQVISDAAATAGFPLVDAHALFASYITNPVTIAGVTINTNYNGGAFSLDGLHPSNTGYALIANQFITVSNEAFGTSVPLISPSALTAIAMNDPFIDFTGAGKVPGRPKSGLLETFAPYFGFSNGPQSTATPKLTQAQFMSMYYQLKGLNPNQKWQRSDIINAVADIIGAPAQ
ncbi:SGNH/GDSL hydrolase family protein [Nevskia soli]|uniref:SGNH/GDSL hydrolase family protein n=1 Tax=Nevskia soli TaxID=418856 RepID=UPI0015D75E34|nr:SGNH/GDSL hydrolase family protein [Nevskia soli]